MSKSLGLKIGKKFVLVITVLPIVAAVLFLLQTQEGISNPLKEASEGGELLLTAIGRSHEFLMNFVNDREELAEEILRTAKEAQDHAKTKLTSAKQAGDDVVVKMAENYEILYGSSGTMTQGVDNLLTVSDNLDSAFSYYRQKKYNESVDEAQVCLQTLAPLVDQFDDWNRSLNDIEYYSIAANQRDRVKHASAQYRSEMKIYNEYVLLLECIAEGVEYSKQMDVVDQFFDQFQHTLAGKDYENATRLLQEIFDRLQILEGPDYQKAAEAASQLDPSLLGNIAYDTAQDMVDRFYSIEGLQSFENYLESLKSFVKSSYNFDHGDLEAAQAALVEGLSLLSEGKSLADPSIQQFYTGLENAFDSLQMKMRGQPDLG